MKNIECNISIPESLNNQNNYIDNIQLIPIIINSNNQILLKKKDNSYELPKGMLRKNERLEDGFKRFVLNDINLHIELLNNIATYNFDNIDIISISYKCVVLEKQSNINDIPDGYIWIVENKLKNIQIEFPFREILTNAIFKP